MNTLFLDSASHKKVIALVTEQDANIEQFPDPTDESSLLPFLEKFLNDRQTSFEQLTHLLTVTGPGGFMSLRTGITLMNTLQWRLGIPAAGIHLSAVWKARLRLPPSGGGEKGEEVLWIHSTKRDAFFVRGFGSYVKRWPEPTLISLDDLQHDIDHETPYVGELLDAQKTALPNLVPFQDAEPLEAVLPTLLSGLHFEKKAVLPWYGRGA